MYDWRDECKIDLSQYDLQNKTATGIKDLKMLIMKDKLQEYQDILNEIISYVENNKPECQSSHWNEKDEYIDDFVQGLEKIIYLEV